MKRVFLIGNGVSMDVAGTPHSRKLIPKMLEDFENDPCEERKKWREQHFIAFRAFLIKLAGDLKNSLQNIEAYKNEIVPADNVFLRDYIFNDIEALLSLIELNLASPPTVKFEMKKSMSPYIGSYFPPFKYRDLEMIKSAVITGLYELLRPEKIRDGNGILRKFCENFVRNGDSIITLNYDLLMEQALWEVGKWTPYDGYLIGVADEIYLAELKQKNRTNSDVKLLKLHGSLNWSTGPFGLGINTRLSNYEEGRSYFTGIETIGPHTYNKNYFGFYDSLIFVPSYIKLFPNSELGKLWKIAVQEVSSANEIYIIGYSFPEADILVDFLLSYISAEAKIFIRNKCKSHELKERMVKKYGKLDIDCKEMTFTKFVTPK